MYNEYITRMNVLVCKTSERIFSRNTECYSRQTNLQHLYERRNVLGGENVCGRDASERCNVCSASLPSLGTCVITTEVPLYSTAGSCQEMAQFFTINECEIQYICSRCPKRNIQFSLISTVRACPLCIGSPFVL